MTLPTSVDIREVGPRDGLQAEQPLAPSDRVRLVSALLDAGVRHVEAVSFVSPRAVPAMAGADEVLAGIGRPEGVTVTALVPNLRGAELALRSGVDELTVTVAASAQYNERNVKMSVDDSVSAISAVCSLASERRVAVDAVVSCAFGSPYEGEIPAAEISQLVSRLNDTGVSTLTLADTTGMATPRVISEVLAAVRAVLGAKADGIGLHLHETRGTGLLNSYAAMQEEVRRFDTSVGGLGGSPFAEGASGNVSTEDFVALLDDLGVSTGIDIEKLRFASAVLEKLVGHALHSRVAYAGPRLRR